MCQVHTDQMKRTARFACLIRDLERGLTVDLSTESTYALHDLEFQAELSRCPKAQSAILTELDSRDTPQKTEESPMAVLNEMEQEARAMLADSRDYHTLDGAFLLVRDGDSVWLCRQTDSVSLDDQERLMCVATQSVPVFTVPDCPECACVQDGQCLCTPSKPHAYAAELDSLHLELRDVHDGEADDDTDFDVWVHDMAANNEGLFQKAAQRFIELEKLLDVQ